MQEDRFDRIISFLLGASWAIVLFGALITFKIFLFFSFNIALFATILYVVVSFFLILALDAFAINREKLKEMNKQTKLLEKISSRYEEQSI